MLASTQTQRQVQIVWDGSPSFFDIVNGVDATLQDLGFQVNKVVDINTAPWNDEVIYIFIPLVRYAVSLTNSCPKRFVYYQIEQPISGWFNENYIKLACKAEQLWIFHATHVNLNKHPCSFYVPFAYHSGLEVTDVQNSNIDKDIDVLFVGAINERRMAVLKALTSRGLYVVVHSSVSRDQHIEMLKRSKVYLNVHYYGEKSVMESARIALAMMHGSCIVTEESMLEAENEVFSKFTVVCKLEEIVDKCCEYAEMVNKNAYSIPRELYRNEFALKPFVKKCVEREPFKS